jgi:hypothetical protein
MRLHNSFLAMLAAAGCGLALALVAAATPPAPGVEARTDAFCEVVPAIPADSVPDNAIIIGWDGAQREHVQQCLSRDELPYLATLCHAGSLHKIDIAERTETKPGFAQIITGCSAKLNLVVSDGEFQPVPAGLSIFERAEAALGDANIATLMVAGKSANLGNAAPEKILLDKDGVWPAAGCGAAGRYAWRAKRKQGKIVEEGGAKYLVIPGEPYYNTARALDYFKNNLGDCDGVGAEALRVVKANATGRFLLFIQFKDPDVAGHSYGENSRAYSRAIQDCDAWLGRIMAELKRLGIDGRTAVYVTADHGFDEGKRHHWNAPYVFLATNDRGVKHGGMRTDITPTVLERLGVDLSKSEFPLTGKPLTR